MNIERLYAVITLFLLLLLLLQAHNYTHSITQARGYNKMVGGFKYNFFSFNFTHEKLKRLYTTHVMLLSIEVDECIREWVHETNEQ